MSDRKLLRVGVIGAAITALCCFTPVLVLLLGALGLSAWVVGLDYVLLPVLVGFVALVIWGLVRKSRAAAEEAGTR